MNGIFFHLFGGAGLSLTIESNQILRLKYL